MYERCETLFRAFTPSEKEFCHALRELRNADIHSGGAVLELILVPNWQLKYYRVCQVLLSTMDMALDDLFPPEQLPTILELLGVDEKNEIKAVRTLISAAKVHANVESLDLDAFRQSIDHIVPDNIDHTIATQRAICPVCRADGKLDLKRVSLSDITLYDERPFRSVNYIPIGFSCGNCQLSLNSYGRMVVAKMAEPIVTEVELDLMELFVDYMAPDYGNE